MEECVSAESDMESSAATVHSLLEENADSIMTDTNQNILKMPVKRKQDEKELITKQAKKAVKSSVESGSVAAGSQVGFTDSSIEANDELYTVDGIKQFLKVNKNMRMVKTSDYFPDPKKRFETIKQLMSERCFDDKEV